jgi:hypothetical protein
MRGYLYCARHGWTLDVVADLGSGMNYRKKGLKRLLPGILAAVQPGAEHGNNLQNVLGQTFLETGKDFQPRSPNR